MRCALLFHDALKCSDFALDKSTFSQAYLYRTISVLYYPQHQIDSQTGALMSPNSMLIRATIGLMSSIFLLGCAHTSAPSLAKTTNPSADRFVESSKAPSLDREAILKMVGEYEVFFQFDETVALAAGYSPTDLKTDHAQEVVILVEDSGDRIVLQHLLLVGGVQVIKHWRQDWIWEASHRFTFSDDMTWDYVMIPEEITRGAWTQCVYGVVDTPRYCGTGRWNHRYGNATWTSDRGWRPLPRRDYSIRNDYNALNVENRHTITPSGWTHEQDNTKVIREGTQTQTTIVREFGFNDYRRTDSINFAPAYQYWNQTHGFWALVREQWQSRLETGQIRLNTSIDGEPIIEELFNLAAGYAEATVANPQEPVALIFDQYVATPKQRALADR